MCQSAAINDGLPFERDAVGTLSGHGFHPALSGLSMGTEDLAKAVEEALLLPQQLRQLRDVRRDLARLVFAVQLGG
jgi:hypothetical protein